MFDRLRRGNHRVLMESLERRDLLTAVSFSAVEFDAAELDHPQIVGSADIDNDGDIDIIYGNEDLTYYWLENSGGKYVQHPVGNYDLSSVVGDSRIRGKSLGPIQPVDMDADGDLDLLMDYSVKVRTPGVVPPYLNIHKTIWAENVDGQGTFSELREFGDARALQAGDLDSDGDTDLFGPQFDFDSQTFQAVWYENLGSGQFTDGRLISDERSTGLAVKAFDIDQDGNLDVVVASHRRVQIFTKSGTVEFQLKQEYEVEHFRTDDITNERIIPLYFGDFNGDGAIDMIVQYRPGRDDLGERTDPFHVYINQGDGTFTDQTLPLYPPGTNPRLTDVQDVDADGDVDLIYHDWGFLGDGVGYPTILWVENVDGNVPYSERRTFDESMYVVSLNTASLSHVAVADMDVDGRNDVLIPSAVANEIRWYAPDANGQTHGTSIGRGFSPGVVATADLDLDGDMDIVRTSQQEIVWYENTNGAGRFDRRHNISTTRRPVIVAETAASDVDGDGDTDVVEVSLFGDVVWYENQRGSWSGPRTIFSSASEGVAINGYFRMADLDGDGDSDAVLSGVFWLENLGDASFGTPQPLYQGAVEADFEKFITTIVDFNRDGHLDIVSLSRSNFQIDETGDLVSGSSEIYWYENNGQAQFTRHVLLDRAGLYEFQFMDVNGDDALDILAMAKRVDTLDDILLFTNHEGQFVESRITGEDFSYIRVFDVDHDGSEDVIIGRQIFESEQGRLIWTGGVLPVDIIPGMAAADLDNDRDLDFVIGGQWLRNSPLTPQDDVRGDFVNEVCTAIYRGSTERKFDRNGDGTVSHDDVTHVIRDVLGTTVADVNLDRRFDSRDLVLLFQAGQYDDGVTGNSTWSTGDFNCDGEFDSSDLVAAFQAGAYVP